MATQAELRALQAQINPHFLFDALNTLYGTIDRGSFEARRLVLNLSDIFRYFLQGNRSFISLAEELRIVKAYLEIEALRLGDRLETELDVGDSALSAMIPILSIQPLVENAVKHGVAAKPDRGRVVRGHTTRTAFFESQWKITERDLPAAAMRLMRVLAWGSQMYAAASAYPMGPNGRWTFPSETGFAVTFAIPSRLL